MMAPVITAETSKELNLLVRSINPLLFWTCNYEPTLSYAISEDAAFLTGIQDLYKFAIDANCVLRGIALKSQNSICPNLLPYEEAKVLRVAVERVQVLRSVIDHNQSDYNSRMSGSQIEAYISWIRSVLGKSEPTRPEDFRALNNALSEIGETLVSASRRAITLLAERSDNDAVVDRWIDIVLKWYCAGTHQELYRGQLSDYYLAKAYASKPNFDGSINQTDLRTTVNRWIGLQAMGQFDVPLRKLERERNEIISASESPSSQELALREKFPEYVDKIAEIRAERLMEIDEEVERIKENRAAYQNKCGNSKVGYFFNSERLYVQLHETLLVMMEAKDERTLLPQDFLQFDIERNFDAIRLP